MILDVTDIGPEAQGNLSICYKPNPNINLKANLEHSPHLTPNQTLIQFWIQTLTLKQTTTLALSVIPIQQLCWTWP